MADHNAELKNHAPKPKKTAKQNMKIALCVSSVQKRRDLKIMKATAVYHTKSQSQWTIANVENPSNPKIWAFSISGMPTANHHR
jgi:hypothetical protein